MLQSQIKHPCNAEIFILYWIKRFQENTEISLHVTLDMYEESTCSSFMHRDNETNVTL